MTATPAHPPWEEEDPDKGQPWLTEVANSSSDRAWGALKSQHVGYRSSGHQPSLRIHLLEAWRFLFLKIHGAISS